MNQFAVQVSRRPSCYQGLLYERRSRSRVQIFMNISGTTLLSGTDRHIMHFKTTELN